MTELISRKWEVKEERGDFYVRTRNRVDQWVGIETRICENINGKDVAQLIAELPTIIKALKGSMEMIEDIPLSNKGVKRYREICEVLDMINDLEKEIA